MISSKVVITAVLGLSVGFGLSYGMSGESKYDPDVFRKKLREREAKVLEENYQRQSKLSPEEQKKQTDELSKNPRVNFHPSFQPYLSENPAIDYEAFAKQVQEVWEYREQRRVSEDDFITMSKDPQTILFDGRSREMYDLLHVKGATNLSLPDITAEQLAKVIPTKETRVLIYCNNNFATDSPRGRGWPFARATARKMAPASLNVYTFNTLYTYGYKNVYELGPLLNERTTKLEFEGSLVGVKGPE